MTLEIKHAFVSGKADGVDMTLVQPSHWNAALSTSMATARILGRTTAGTGAIEELQLTGSGKVVLDTSPNFTGPVGIGMTPVNILDITQTQNAESAAVILNANTGTGGASGFFVRNSAHGGYLRLHSTGFTTAGPNRADGLVLGTDGSGGISFYLPSNSYRFFQSTQQIAEMSASAGFGVVSGFGTTSILPPAVTSGSSAGTNYDIGAASEYLGYRIQLIWNAGDGYAECYINSASQVRQVASSQGVGGGNQFDTTNNFASNSGEGIALTVSGGRVYVQTKSSYSGTTVKVHRFGGV